MYETVPLCFEILGPRHARIQGGFLLRRCCEADAAFTFLMNDLIEGHPSTVRDLVGCCSFCSHWAPACSGKTLRLCSAMRRPRRAAGYSQTSSQMRLRTWLFFFLSTIDTYDQRHVLHGYITFHAVFWMPAPVPGIFRRSRTLPATEPGRASHPSVAPHVREAVSSRRCPAVRCAGCR